MTSRSLISGLAIASAFGLVGCSSDSDNSLSSFIEIGQSVLAGRNSTSVTLQQAAGVPFATMGVRVGDGSEFIVILTTSTGDQLWVGGAASIITRNGKIVRTVGLPKDLSHLAADNNIPFRTDTNATQRWTDDFDDSDGGSVMLDCEAIPKGPEDVVILGKIIATQRVDETCTGVNYNWHFTNSYWLGEKSGTVWRSVQYVAPDADPVTTEILRPAR